MTFVDWRVRVRRCLSCVVCCILFVVVVCPLHVDCCLFVSRCVLVVDCVLFVVCYIGVVCSLLLVGVRVLFLRFSLFVIVLFVLLFC